MSNIHAILIPFNYSQNSDRRLCNHCDSTSCGYLVPAPGLHLPLFFCFVCADIIFEASPGLFDESFSSGGLVLLPLAFVRLNQRNRIKAAFR